MKRLSTLLGAVAVLLGIAACGPLPSREAYFGQLQTWVGLHADMLARNWGPPDKSFKLSDGSTLLQYERVRQRYVPGMTVPDHEPALVRGNDGKLYRTTVTRWRQTPGYYDIDRCSTRFTTAPDGIITTFQFEGDDCVAYPPPQPKVG